MLSNFNRSAQNIRNYWTLTPTYTSFVNIVNIYSIAENLDVSVASGIKPALNLKSNVIITGGDGTKNNPFTIELG